LIKALKSIGAAGTPGMSRNPLVVLGSRERLKS
jgi:hypothetical protein